MYGNDGVCCPPILANEASVYCNSLRWLGNNWTIVFLKRVFSLTNKNGETFVHVAQMLYFCADFQHKDIFEQ